MLAPQRRGLIYARSCEQQGSSIFFLSETCIFWLFISKLVVVGHQGFSFFCSILDFYKELHQFLIKVGSILSNLYGENWEKKLEVHNDLEYIT